MSWGAITDIGGRGILGVVEESNRGCWGILGVVGIGNWGCWGAIR